LYIFHCIFEKLQGKTNVVKSSILVNLFLTSTHPVFFPTIDLKASKAIAGMNFVMKNIRVNIEKFEMM
jgi:hypothetical protein